jgi:FkbM family methyltransferase
MLGHRTAALVRLIAPIPGAWRLSSFVDRIAPGSGTVEARLFGLPISLDLSDYMQRSIYVGGYELEETALMRAFVKRGMTVVDIGANVGYYTALAAKLVGDKGRVLSFEPSAPAFAKLRGMVDSRCSQVTLFNVALGAREDSLTLYLPPDEEHNLNPSMYEYRTGMVPVTVPVTTLDSVLDGIERVDFLKIDVEGYEPLVLRGGIQSLQRGRIRNILYESNPRMLALANTSPQELYEQLLGMGYFEAARITHRGATEESSYDDRLMTLRA